MTPKAQLEPIDGWMQEVCDKAINSGMRKLRDEHIPIQG